MSSFERVQPFFLKNNNSSNSEEKNMHVIGDRVSISKLS